MFTDIYLCLKVKNLPRYECKAFEDFLSADNYYKTHVNKEAIDRSTMIPICKFNPFKQQTLWYSLANHKIDIIPFSVSD